MDLPDKSNPAQPKKKVEPVVASSKQVQRPASRRFFDSVFADSPKEILKNVVKTTFVPRLKAGVEEALGGLISGMLWGDPRNRPMSNVVQGTVIRGGGVNYNAISNSPSSMAAIAGPQGRTSHGYRDLVFPTLQDAEAVLGYLYGCINEYRVVAVGDLYEAANQPASAIQISDNHIGWTSLDGARISAGRNGYVLELPRPVAI